MEGSRTWVVQICWEGDKWVRLVVVVGGGKMARREKGLRRSFAVRFVAGSAFWMVAVSRMVLSCGGFAWMVVGEGGVVVMISPILLA